MLINNKRILESFAFIVISSIIFNSIIIDKLAILYIFIISLILGKKEKSFLNPYNLFAITPLSLLIYFNVFGHYMLDLSHETYILAIINMVIFILALLITPSFKVSKINKCKKTASKLFLKINTIVLFLLALLTNLFPFLQSILWLFSIAAIVCALKTKEKSMLFLIFGYFFYVGLGEVSKMTVLMFILTFLISYDKYYTITESKKLHLRFLTVFSVVFLIYAFTFANKERGKSDINYVVWYYSKQGVNWQYSNSLFLPYMYLTTPWTNLQYVKETQNTRTNGMWTIKPLLSYLQMDEDYKKDYKLVPYSSFNTFTFIITGFKDFGYWLSVLPTLFLGFFVKKIYSRYLVSDSPFDVASYAVVALSVIEMFFSNHFFMLSYPFTMVILMEIYKFVACRPMKLINKNSVFIANSQNPK